MNRRTFFAALPVLPAAAKAIALAPPPSRWAVGATSWFKGSDPIPTSMDDMFESMWADAQNPRPSTIFMSQETHRHLIERGLA